MGQADLFVRYEEGWPGVFRVRESVRRCVRAVGGFATALEEIGA